MTSAVVQWMLQTTIIAAAMIPIVIALGRTVLRHRPAAQHALWAVLLLKFITPAIIVWPWAVPDIRDSVGALWTRWTGASEVAGYDVDLSSASPDIIVAPVADGPLITLDTMVSVLFLAWIIGCALVAARCICRIALQARALNRGSSAPSSLARAIADVAGRMNLLPLPAIVVRGIRSPFVWCLGRLRLAWPESMACEIGEREGEHGFEGTSLSIARPIIAHELAHIRRRDHWLAWIELAASIMWWWNPLFWIVRRNLRITSEMACDALALAAYPDERCAYAETLLALSALSSTRAPALGLAATAGSRPSFERRMSMIVSERATGRHTRPTLLLAGLLAAVSIPAWSFNQTQAEEVAKVQSAKGKRAAAEADRAKLVELEEQLRAHMVMLDERQAILQEQARGGASLEALAELQSAREMVQARIEALHAEHADLADDLRKYVQTEAAALEKRKVDLHHSLVKLELKRAELLEKTAGNPDPVDVAALEEARVLLIEKMHSDMATLDAGAQAKFERTKKPAPPDADAVKRHAIHELLHEIFHPGSAQAQQEAEEAAAAQADALEAHLQNRSALQKEWMHRYLTSLAKRKQAAEGANADEAAALHNELMRRYLMQLDKQKHAEVDAEAAGEAAAVSEADLHKKRHMEMLKVYREALADQAAAAGDALTDADRAKLEAHARMLKEELARKAEVDARNAEGVKPRN